MMHLLSAWTFMYFLQQQKNDYTDIIWYKIVLHVSPCKLFLQYCIAVCHHVFKWKITWKNKYTQILASKIHFFPNEFDLKTRSNINHESRTWIVRTISWDRWKIFWKKQELFRQRNLKTCKIFEKPVQKIHNYTKYT